MGLSKVVSRRTYTDDERVHALELYATDGPTAVERQLGIPKTTVAGWAAAAGVGTVRNERIAAAVDAARLDRELVREHLRDEMLRRAVDLLDRMDEPHVDFKGKDAAKVTYPKPSPSGCQAYATAAAILLDKFRLEVGEVTGRTETRTSDHLDREIEELVEQLQAKGAQ